MNPVIDLAYINYWHGGLAEDPVHTDGCTCLHDHTGLVRLAGEDGRWPDVLVMGEGVNYTDYGGRGMWGAVAAMRTAGSPPYVPLPGTLPRDWGNYAPVTFINPLKLIIKQSFGDPNAHGWASRVRNLTVVQPVDGTSLLHLTTLHGDMGSSAYRQEDARALRWLANDRIFSVIMADWNETLSGPGWEPGDMGDPTKYAYPWKFHHRLRTQPGFPGRPAEPYTFATHALDYLVGYWNERLDQRVSGIGFTDACEQAGIRTPTNLPRPGGAQGKQLLHVLLNGPLADRIVPGSVRVHEPLDLDRPDSDHKRISVTVTLP